MTTHCVDCGVATKGSKRCRSCAAKARWAGKLVAQSYCIDCGLLLSGSSKKRCRSCARVAVWEDANSGSRKLYPKQPDRFCVDCGAKLKGDHNPVRCKCCAQKEKWADPIFRLKTTKGLIEAGARKEVRRGRSMRAKAQWDSGNLDMRGSKNPNWLGGKSFEHYGPDFNEEFKVMVRKYDNNICAICGNAGCDVHHIDYDKRNNTLGNCILLCKSCHMKTNHNRKYWEQYLLEIG